MLIVQSLMSGTQKTIWLIDDVSTAFSKIKSSKKIVSFTDSDGNIKTMKEGEAYKSILTDIYTTGRNIIIIIRSVFPKNLTVHTIS